MFSYIYTDLHRQRMTRMYYLFMGLDPSFSIILGETRTRGGECRADERTAAENRWEERWERSGGEQRESEGVQRTGVITCCTGQNSTFAASVVMDTD